MQSSQKENGALNEACVLRKAARAESFLEITKLGNENGAQRKRIVELTRHLAEETVSKRKEGCR